MKFVSVLGDSISTFEGFVPHISALHHMGVFFVLKKWKKGSRERGGCGIMR